MSQYLRDEVLKNLTITECNLKKINEELIEISKQFNLTVPTDQDKLFHSYIIRFDNKGFRLFDFGEVLKYFSDAHKVERVCFYVNSLKGLEANGFLGNRIELKFDKYDTNNCALVIDGDKKAWVDTTFWKINERLNKYQNTNYFIRNRWIPFTVQILGVIIGFFFSFITANKIAPALSINNSLAFSFIIIFLLFSNIWTFIFEGIMRIIDYFWPNISFKEKGKSHWFVKTFISTAFVSLFIFLLSRVFIYIGNVFKAIIR